MRIFRNISATIATLLLLGTALTLFLTILTGGTQTSILKKLYWLETDCSKYPGAPFNSRCRWTNYGLCAVENGENTNCTHAVAAYPFSPDRNFNSNDDLPSSFIDHSNYYYYTSRIGWAFTLIGLAFVVFSMLPYFLHIFIPNAVFTSLFWIMYVLAIIFTIVGISLSTAAFSRGRSKFRDDGAADTNFGTKTMAVAWTSFFLILFNLLFLSGSFAKWTKSSNKNSISNNDNYNSNSNYDSKNVDIEQTPIKKQSKFVTWFNKPISGNNNVNNNPNVTNTAPSGGLSFTPVNARSDVKNGLQPVDNYN
ncbi:Fmp45 protein [Pichia kluyveri]|uniref:Fmp45 protein n=1 Tax=Pichia kluyveri TaxID=36015 RepID=A0AAV5R4B9_PICKL|nr:Fmp45 protein [Pichia kluyveri]